MSLIDPSTRWWNRNPVRRAAAWACWILSMLAVFVVGWTFDMSFEPETKTLIRPEVVIAVLYPLGLMLLLAGVFLYFLSDDGDNEFKPRVVFIPLACTFMVQGLGGVAHRLAHGLSMNLIAISFVAVGALALIVIEAIIRHIARNQVLREKVKRSGIVTRGKVTRARGYSMNYTPVTRVTVAFVDNEGRKRWASQSIGGRVRVGQTLTVRYSPADLERRAAVIVES